MPGSRRVRRNLRIVRDLVRLSMPVVLLLLVFVLALYVVSLTPGEQRVWARVTKPDQTAPGLIAEFRFAGDTYEVSIDGRGRLAPGDAVPLHFFFSPRQADWLSHRGGRGPYTWTSTVLGAIAFFGVAAPGVIGVGRYLKAHKARLERDSRRCGRLLRRLWTRSAPPSARPFIAVGLAVLGVVMFGFVGQLIFGHSPTDTPDESARAYLTALVRDDPNEACGYIAPEERYRFLSEYPQWRLEAFELLGPPKRKGKWAYHSHNMHLSIGEGDDLWTVPYRYQVSTGGRTIEGASELRLVYLGRGFCIQEGYRPVQSNDVNTAQP